MVKRPIHRLGGQSPVPEMDELAEESIITLSIVKWIFLASIIGAFVGGAITLFIKIIAFGIALVHILPYYYCFLPFIPFDLFGSFFIPR